MKKLVQSDYSGKPEILDPSKHTLKVTCEICGDQRWYPASSSHQIKKLCKPCVNLVRQLRRLGMKIP